MNFMAKTTTKSKAVPALIAMLIMSLGFNGAQYVGTSTNPAIEKLWYCYDKNVYADSKFTDCKVQERVIDILARQRISNPIQEECYSDRCVPKELK
jgi:hypothetical protein